MIRLLLPLCSLLPACSMNAQDLSAHQWQDRVLLVLVEDANDPQLAAQLTEWRSHTAGLRERKLVVYTVTPERYRVGLGADGAWQTSPRPHNQNKKTEAPFELVLIGLDGGVKLLQSELLPCTDLFARIDRMPMRQRELRTQKRTDGYR